MKKLLVILAMLTGIIGAQSKNLPLMNHSPARIDDSKIIKSVKVQAANKIERKVSPYINFVVHARQNSKNGSFRIAKVLPGLSKVIEYNQISKAKITLDVLIKSSDVFNTISVIKENGGEYHSIVNNIITAEIPLKSVYSVAAEKSVEYVDASYIREEKLDVSKGEIKADKVNNELKIDGKGVVVGVLDSGIDWSHPVFGGNNGTRIKYLWDQSGSGSAPSGYNYGTEYTKSQIDAGNCNEVDSDNGHGHGTHVSSTAAGYDYISDKYHGIAPGADIVFVKGFRNGPGFADNDVVDGCNYIFSKAQSLGEPCVINLSLGGHYGPHDGTSLYEQALSNMTGEGKIIVVAAGNEGGDQIHAGYATSGTDVNSSQKTIFAAFEKTSAVLIDIWYASGNISFGLVAYDKTSGDAIGTTQAVSPGNVLNNEPFTVNSTTYGYVTIDASTTSDPNNHHKRVVVYLDSKNGTYELSNVWWGLYSYGSGTFDAWLANGSGYFTADDNASAGIHPGDNDKSVGMPSTAKKVICVGSYMTKKSWQSKNGNTYSYKSGTVGDISDFSSRGPSRDGRIKPDISAPGQGIVAALSSNLTLGVGAHEEYIVPGGKFQLMQGTSMATPHITGVVALMLQKNSKLDYASTLATLTSTARTDNFTGTVPNNKFGAGKVDAYAAVQSLGGGGGGGGGTQTTLLKENFDGASFPPSGWGQQVTISGYTWMQGNPKDNSFSSIDSTNVYSALCPYTAQDQNELLYSPPFSLGNGEAYVEFYAGHSTQWLSAATMGLFITADSGAHWTKLWQAQNDGEPWKWRPIKVILTSYQNTQNLILGWLYAGNDGDLVALDNVKLVGYPYGVSAYNEEEIVKNYELSQNYPNPFNPSTKIRYQIPKSGPVRIVVFDVLGREVKTLLNKVQSAGKYRLTFHADNLASGIYLLQMKAGGFLQTRKLMLIK